MEFRRYAVEVTLTQTTVLCLLFVLGTTLYCIRKIRDFHLDPIPGDSIFRNTVRFVLVFCSISICTIVIGVGLILFPGIMRSLAREYPMNTALFLLCVLGTMLYIARKMGDLGLFPGESIFNKTTRFILALFSISICTIVFVLDLIIFPGVVRASALGNPMGTALFFLCVFGTMLYIALKMGVPGESIFNKTARFVLACFSISICIIGPGVFRVYYSRGRPSVRTVEEIAAENRRKWPAPVLKADLPTYLTYLCQNKHSPCVIDFTASTRCEFVGDDLPSNPGSLSANLDRFTSVCTMYQWEKNGRIYVVKPKLPSDSPLGVQTGPLHESLAASALIDRLCYMSRLRCGGPNPLSGLGARGQAPPEKEPVADYILPHDTFINNLIRAAKQSGHSYWLVERQYAPTGLTFEYRANDLDSKKRYGYYVMPK